FQFTHCLTLTLEFENRPNSRASRLTLDGSTAAILRSSARTFENLSAPYKGADHMLFWVSRLPTVLCATSLRKSANKVFIRSKRLFIKFFFFLITVVSRVTPTIWTRSSPRPRVPRDRVRRAGGETVLPPRAV